MAALSSSSSSLQHQYAFIDVDVDGSLKKRSLAAAFVKSTNLRYGFSSSDIRALGGSELTRLQGFYEVDNEWAGKGDIEVDMPAVSSRIVMKLYFDKCPLACENFMRLCKAEEAGLGDSGKKLTYEGCIFHRIVPGFVMQTGDFVFNNGSGGESVFGKKFKDEKNGLNMKHDRRGVLSMGNSGKNSNTSQFFITFAKAPQCDGKHVVFGEVVQGYDIIQLVEENALKEVTIVRAGAWLKGETPSAGYLLNVPDPDSYAGYTQVFHSWPRILLVCGGNAEVEERFKINLKTLRVVFVDAGGNVDDNDNSNNNNVDVTVYAKLFAPPTSIDPTCELISTPKEVLDKVLSLLNSKNWVPDRRT